MQTAAIVTPARWYSASSAGISPRLTSARAPAAEPSIQPPPGTTIRSAAGPLPSFASQCQPQPMGGDNLARRRRAPQGAPQIGPRQRGVRKHFEGSDRIKFVKAGIEENVDLHRGL